MPTFQPGLVHTPITPFKRDQNIDFGAFEKLIEFHLRNGADSIALLMPQAEDISLADEEARKVMEFAVKRIKGRVPVIAHVSDAGTDIAIDRARHAERIGATAIATHPPYFWHPKPAMIVEHITRIGKAVSTPLFVCSPPVESAGTALTTEILLQVAERLPNLAGLVDASMDWVFMAEAISNGQQIRPGFQLLPATDYMVFPAVLGGRGVFSLLSCIAPKLVRDVHELCLKQQFTQARKPQEDIASLHHLVKSAGFAGLKGALRAMGRDCGEPRPPSRALTAAEQENLAAQLNAMSALREEPRGW